MQDLSDGMKSAESEQNNARGASPHPPLDASSRAQGPRHIRHHSKLRTRSLCCRQDSEHDAPPPKHLTKHPGRRRTSDTPRCFPPHEPLPSNSTSRLSPVPSYDVVPHQTGSAKLKTDRRSPLQAESSLIAVAASAVFRRRPTPHRWLQCNIGRRGPLRAGNGKQAKTPGHQQEGRCFDVRKNQHP